MKHRSGQTYAVSSDDSRRHPDGGAETESAEKLEAAAEPTHRDPFRARVAVFDPEWYDAKEIVVPFDDSSLIGELVDEKAFAAAYARRRPPPNTGTLRLETHQVMDRLSTGSSLSGGLSVLWQGGLFFVEAGLMVWTTAVLHSGFSIPKWTAWSLVGGWVLILIILRAVMARPAAFRKVLWLGGVIVMLAWVRWSPWSDEMLTNLRSHFFLT